ncbi:hypothetical protein LDENG_00073740 [Lucifuga dentata]|nr:hypothetical protein LDENG_00073740 [Lucifuga dentata]
MERALISTLTPYCLEDKATQARPPHRALPTTGCPANLSATHTKLARNSSPIKITSQNDMTGAFLLPAAWRSSFKY